MRLPFRMDVVSDRGLIMRLSNPLWLVEYVIIYPVCLNGIASLLIYRLIRLSLFGYRSLLYNHSYILIM